MQADSWLLLTRQVETLSDRFELSEGCQTELSLHPQGTCIARLCISKLAGARLARHVPSLSH